MRRFALTVAAFACSLLPALHLAPAFAVTMNLQSESSPQPGVTVRHYRTTGPTTRLWVALIDLCSDRVHVDATYAPSGFQTTGSWAADQGAVLAVNGDFYKSGPRVYGQAVGRGVPWPLEQTGADPGYSWEWFYEKYGWIAFGPDWVEFNHTKLVKNAGGVSTGFRPNSVTAAIPDGTLALVSGFPELVIEGQPVTCSSPTASGCFPDRSDMRARHPRTAMGLTADRQTLILLVVDGRTSVSAGMYGTELAEVMGKLGAHVAFNLDGGGSTQMWQAGAGYLNNAKGNNGGSSYRSVGNHWGVFAGSGTGKPRRPGHCQSRPPCKVLGATGGAGATVDDSGSCFQAFGPSQYWREVAGAGEGGGLHWTNAFRSELPSNWAWWQLHPEKAGRYRVEVSTDPAYAVYSDTPYLLHTTAGDHAITQDQSLGSGWLSLGSFDFGAGGGQFLAVYDNAPVSIPSGQHVMADAVRLTPVRVCGDGSCQSGEDCGSCPADCSTPDADGDGLADACDGCPADAANDADEDDVCGNLDNCPAVANGDQLDTDGDGQGDACTEVSPPTCGDGTCATAEDCQGCPGDCGTCSPDGGGPDGGGVDGEGSDGGDLPARVVSGEGETGCGSPGGGGPTGLLLISMILLLVSTIRRR